MFKNNLKIAWRSLKNQPFITSLNVFGLAIGMAGALLIGLYIYDELGYDKMFADTDRIYRLNVDMKFGGVEDALAVMPAPMAEVVQDEFPQVEKATRLRTLGSVFLKKVGSRNKVKESNITYADPSFFDFLGINLLVGDRNTALRNPNTLVLTRSAAKKLFPINQAIGQTLEFDDGETYTVTGVVEDFPKNSLLRNYTVFMAMSGYADSKLPIWGSHNYTTFIKLRPNSRIQDVDRMLPNIVDTHVFQWAQTIFPGITKEQFNGSGNYIRYSTIPLSDIHLHSNRRAEISDNNDIQNIYILSFVAIFLLVLASVNFMNLSTAGSLKRAKEVGIRKTLGSGRGMLVRQFLTESGLIVFGALIAGVALAWAVLPYFNDLTDKQLAMPIGRPTFWGVILLGTVLLGLLSGSYPAFFLSRFIPVKVLSGTSGAKAGGGKLRNTLVIFQFAISVFLIVATLVVYGQLRFIQHKDLGYQKEQVVILPDAYTMGTALSSFKAQVKALPQVQDASLSSYYPTPSVRSDNSYFEEGVTDQEKAVNMQTWDVDFDYVPTLGLTIVAGRDFDRVRPADSTAMLVNESALKVLGLTPEEVQGKRFSASITDEEPRYLTVVGVIKDFHFTSLRNPIGPLCLTIGKYPGGMAIKLKAGDPGNTLAQLENLWTQTVPGQPFDYYFMDDAFNDTYKSDQRLGSLFIIFTVLSILVACLGLFGLATFNAQKRTKEIGVRKVLGASVAQVTYRLTADFLKLVLVAVAIALPLGWFAMDRWLQDFTYKTGIPWWILLLAALLAIGVAVLTIGYQSIRAARANPVKSLRTE